MAIDIEKARCLTWSLTGLKNDDSGLPERGDHASLLAWMKISHVATEIKAYSEIAQGERRNGCWVGRKRRFAAV